MSRVILAVSNSFSRRFIASDEMLKHLRDKLVAETIIVEPKEWYNSRPTMSKIIMKLKSKIYDVIYIYRFLFFEDYLQNIALLEKYILLHKKWPFKMVVIQFTSKFQFVKWLLRFIELWTLKDKYITKKFISSDILIVTYAVNYFEAKMLYNASRIGVKTINAVLSWDNIMCKGQFAILPNYFLVWGEEMRKEIIAKYNFKKENIFIGGVPHFSVSQKVLLDRGYIVFAMSAHRFAPTEVEIIKSLHQGLIDRDIDLVVRPHPQNLHGPMSSKIIVKELEYIAGLPNVRVVWPRMSNYRGDFIFEHKDSIEYQTTLKNALCVINSGSTASVEALLLNTPVILASFDMPQKYPFWNSARRLINFPHIQKLLISSGIHVAHSINEMLGLIPKVGYQNTDDEYLKTLVEATGQDSIELITNAIRTISKDLNEEKKSIIVL